MAKQLKRWQGWLLFGGSMVVVFIWLTRVVALRTKGRSGEHLQ